MTTAIEAGPVDSRFAWDAGATLLDLFETRVRDDGTRVAMRHRDDAGSWRSITWADYGRAVHEVASGLAAIGIRPGDRVGILAWNRPEWHEADLGILRAGAISVPVYPTSAGPQVAYVLAHSGCRVCFVGDREQLDRVRDQLAELPALECVVTFDDVDALDDPLVRTLEELRALGAETPAVPPAVTPEHVATLVYTSGTTGPPKGAVITHKNAMATLRSVTQVVPLTEQERFLSFLPLSHITERSVSHFGLVASGGETWFARSISTIAEDLPACRPTIFFAVPRVWEKLREGVEAAVAQLSGPAGALARRYLDYARRGVDRLGPADRVARQALDLVVGRRLRAQIGLDAARFCVSGAAPIHPELLRWFAGIGIPIAEGYGQTEVALATTLNPPDAIRVGTVGPPLPGVTVRIAEDGEILVRGDNVCRGYWNDEAGTRALLGPGGWLHSGDLGSFDDHGYLRITGRKKDLIITAHGKNIAPQTIETDLAATPLVAQAVVIGEGRRYLTALLALDAEAVTRWAAEHGKDGRFEDLTRDPDVRAEIQRAVEEVNARHSRVEQVRKWRVLPAELTVAGGELTPTLKVKRAVVAERYADLIDEMYAD